MEKKPEPNVEQLDPDLKMSFASDRNPYFLDFNKSMRNHSHDIINRLSNKDKFKRKDKQWEMIRMKSKNNDNMTLKPVQPKVLPQKLSLSESVSSLNLTKCNNIINDWDPTPENKSVSRIKTKKVFNDYKTPVNLKSIDSIKSMISELNTKYFSVK